MKQHFNPRRHLKRFSFDGKHLYILLKKDSRITIGDYETQCQRQNFYESDELQRGSAEYQFMKWEQEFLYDEVEKYIEKHRKFPAKHVESTAKYLAIQIARTKKIREKMRTEIVPDAIEEVKSIHDETLKERGCQIDWDAQQAKLTSESALAKSQFDLCKRIEAHDRAKLLRDDSLWFVGLSENDEFVTSDDPVTKPGTGLCDMGTTVHYPLSTRMCLCIYDKNYWGKQKRFGVPMLKLDKRCFIFKQHEIEKVNRHQYDGAMQCVYSKDKKALETLLEMNNSTNGQIASE